MEKEIMDLGWANGWTSTPEALQEASKQNCETKCVLSDRDRHIDYYECETPTAILKYRVDTSG